MDAETWQSVKALFQQVLDLPEGERRAAVAAAPASPVVRAEVDALLVAAAGALPAAPAPPLPAAFGPYRPLRVLGQGGMGVVYLAERTEGGFRQQVAIKAIAGSLIRPDARRRFERERQILAGLGHPHIARLLDGGVSGDGAPYFAMEWIDGVAIDRWCDEQRLGLRERLRLLLQVVDAVDYAHRNLVVHRDLKPGNVLIAGGAAKLLDFGIARLLELDDPGAGTASGERAMTPEYAAPEQIAGDAVGVATDVHGLGLLAYELLCGRLPYPLTGDRLAHAQAVLQQEPPPLRSAASRRAVDGDRRNADLAELAARRGTSVAGFRRGLDRELDAIVAKALARRPEDRYAGAAALGADLRAYLEDRPLAALADGPLRRLAKYTRRHRFQVGAAAALLATAAVGVTSTLWQARHAAEEAATARAVRRTLTGLFTAADPDSNGGSEPTVREALDAGVDRVAEELAGQPAARRALLSDAGAVYTSLGKYERALAVLRLAQPDGDPVADDEGARVLLRQADALTTLSQFDPARTALDRIAAHLSGRSPLDPLVVESELAWIRLEREVDQRASATARAERLIARLEPAQPPQPQALAQALGQLGEIRIAERHEVDAIAPLRRARDLQVAAGAGSIEVAEAELLLARAQAASGKPEDGVATLQAALTAQERRLGANHPITLGTVNQLALATSRFGDPEVPHALFQRLVDGRRERFGDRHPATAVAYNNLGTFEYGRKRYAEAAEWFGRARSIWLATLGPDHDFTLSATGNLAGALAEIDRAGDAVPLLDAVVAARRTRGNDNPLYSSLLTRGLALEKAGRDDAARADFREAQAIGRRVWPGDYAQWTWADALLGRNLRRAGDIAAAETLLRRATTEYDLPRYLPGGLRKATANFELAALLAELHRSPDEVRAFATTSADIRERLLGADHPETRAARDLAASTLPR